MPSQTTAALAPINDTDANFRLWGKAVSDALALMGFVKVTGDTGQINWATVVKPAAAGTVSGFEIWRSDDATVGNGLNNYYLKIEYGASTFGQTIPNIWFTVGWGSNGSGTLTGNTSTRAVLYANTPTTTLFNSHLAGSTGWAAISLFNGSNTWALMFSVERTRNYLGVEQDEVFMFLNYASNSKYTQTIPRTGIIPAQFINSVGSMILTAAQASYDGALGISLWFPIKGNLLMPSANVIGGDSTNFTTASQLIYENIYGATRTYIQLGTGSYFGSSTQLLMRWADTVI